MNKGVLISIQPKWCAKIASGHKTVEIRKTKPVLAPPFKVYIYCTKPNTTDPHEYLETHSGEHIYKCNGKVFAEFVCDEVQTVLQCNSGWVAENACLSQREFFEYLGIPQGTHGGYDKKAYAWHISDLIIYDKPRDLSEFRTICRHYIADGERCGDCPYYSSENNESYRYEECVVEGLKPIKRPPRSWCYAEEVPKRTSTGEPDGDFPLFY